MECFTADFLQFPRILSRSATREATRIFTHFSENNLQQRTKHLRKL